MGPQKIFVKFIFYEPGRKNSPFIIQYIGNDEISQAHAHRNAKNTARPFVRTKPSSLERWLKQTKLEDPNAVYKKRNPRGGKLGMEVNEKATPNLSVLSAADKKRKAGRKCLRPGDFDYILEEDEQSNMITEEPTKMSNKFSEKFVTMQRKLVTDETCRKPMTDVTLRKTVTGDNVTEDTI